MRINFFALLKEQTTHDLMKVGVRPTAFTRCIVMPARWYEMSPSEDMFRLVVDWVCFDSKPSGKRTRADQFSTGQKYHRAVGEVGWAVATMSGFVFGRGRPKSLGSCELEPFTSREDACEHAGFSGILAVDFIEVVH